VVGARKGHPLRHVGSLRELADANWVIYTPAGWSGAIIPDIFEKNGLPPPKSVVRSDSYVSLLSILAGTDLVGALSSMFFDQKLARDFFVPFDIKEKLPEITLCLFERSDSPLTSVAASMVAAMKAAARKLAFSKRRE
jgi:DNA-binding transcriptional LysR family regulator